VARAAGLPADSPLIPVTDLLASSGATALTSDALVGSLTIMMSPPGLLSITRP
jgi:hypothetical protein